MTTRGVPKVAVEESKAQRIQRQQARFRDRGGAETWWPHGVNGGITRNMGSNPGSLVLSSPHILSLTQTPHQLLGYGLHFSPSLYALLVLADTGY